MDAELCGVTIHPFTNCIKKAGHFTGSPLFYLITRAADFASIPEFNNLYCRKHRKAGNN
jgi:hypothetical protein